MAWHIMCTLHEKTQSANGRVVRSVKRILLLSLLVSICTSCNNVEGAPEASTDQASRSSASPTLSSESHVGSMTRAEATPTRVVPTPTSIPEPALVFLEATVWTSQPRVPVLVYHRFLPDHYPYSTKVKMRLGDFRDQLERLYRSGYTLIALDRWLSGEILVPEGRRPLILTIDDLFFADQVALTEDGVHSIETGLGVLWQFAQEFPEFGNAVALFPNLGNKLYPGGEEVLAQVIAYSIEHGAIPYNHFYMHPMLELTNPRGIHLEAERNDRYLRELLRLIEREDLIAQLGNIIALTYGVWPDQKAGRDAILAYVTPEGMALQAILEVDFAVRAKFLAPPYAESFDRLHVPRIVATEDAIKLLTETSESFPAAHVCSIGPLDPAREADVSYLQLQILKSRRENGCPDGVYVIGHNAFRVNFYRVDRIFPASPSDYPSDGHGEKGP